MKWIGITGSWRTSSDELKQDLAREIQKVLSSGNGIVTGGALGVDYTAAALALEHALDGSQLRVILPTSLETYAAHYRKRASERVITSEEAESLINQLNQVKELGSLVENMEQSEVNERTYYLRNSMVVEDCDELLGFQVNKSAGTQDTIDKARQRGIPVRVFAYTVN